MDASADALGPVWDEMSDPVWDVLSDSRWDDVWAPVWAEDSRDHSSVPDTPSVAVGRVARGVESDTASDTVSVWV